MQDTTMPPSAPPQPESKRRGWMKPVLIASLSANFLVLGVVMGGVIGHLRSEPDESGHRERGLEAVTFGPLGSAFDRDDRQAMRAAAQSRGADLVALRDAMRQDLTRLEVALRAEPFDARAVQSVMAEMRGRTLKRMELGETLMLERLQSMTPDQRAKLVERMQRGLAKVEARMQERAAARP